MELTFQSGTPTESGVYLAVCLLNGEKIIMQAEYSVTPNKWVIEQLQADEPYWKEFIVEVEAWAEFPWLEFS